VIRRNKDKDIPDVDYNNLIRNPSPSPFKERGNKGVR
jgi:hypothetical protein